MSFKNLICFSEKENFRFDCNFEFACIHLKDMELKCYSIVFTANNIPLGFVYCMDASDFKQEIKQWKRTGEVSLPDDPLVGILRCKDLSVSVRKELSLLILDDILNEYCLRRSTKECSLANFLLDEGIEI